MVGKNPPPTRNTRSIANQKYGTDCIRVVPGMMWSTQVPRFQPIHAPPAIPTKNEMIVARPTRVMVQGRAELIKPVTGSGNLVSETPKSHLKIFPQYSRYCCHRDTS